MEVNKEMCTFAKNKKNINHKRNIQQEMNIDRDYYIAAICEEFPADGLSDEKYFKVVNEAIDKTISQYPDEVDDWDMFDQDLYNNVYDGLENASV